MAFYSGHYTATWNGADIGTTRDGFRIREIHHTEQILTDDGGDAPVDGVQRGTEILVTLDYVEYDKIEAALYAANPQGTPKANVGRLLSTVAKPLVLTPTTYAPAGVWAFTLAVVEGDIETILAARLRQGPITFRCYPNNTTGTAYI